MIPRQWVHIASIFIREFELFRLKAPILSLRKKSSWIAMPRPQSTSSQPLNSILLHQQLSLAKIVSWTSLPSAGVVLPLIHQQKSGTFHFDDSSKNGAVECGWMPLHQKWSLCEPWMQKCHFKVKSVSWTKLCDCGQFIQLCSVCNRLSNGYWTSKWGIARNQVKGLRSVAGHSSN